MSHRSVGIDVGGTYMKTAVLEGSTVVESERVDLPDDRVIEAVEGLARELLSETKAPSIGVGLAGLVRWPEGEFVWGPHVSGQAVPYRARLETSLGVPVVVDNDANLAALGEAHLGAGAGRDPVLMLTFGTGIGCGVVVGGEVYHGVSFAGEVGHMILQPHGSPCACGRRGCWETLVSGWKLAEEGDAIVRRSPRGILAALAEGQPVKVPALAKAAAEGDQEAVGALAEAGRWLGRGITNLVALLDPEIVILGGGLIGAGDWLLDPAREAVAGTLSGAHVRTMIEIRPAVFGDLAGAVGAAVASRAYHGEHGR
jgi:glucokinase